MTINSNKSTKAKFLQKVSEKWRVVPYMYVERWLSNMEDHINRNREQFTRTYESYEEEIVYSSQSNETQSPDSNSIIFTLNGTIVGLRKQKQLIEQKLGKYEKHIALYTNQLELQKQAMAKLKQSIKEIQQKRKDEHKKHSKELKKILSDKEAQINSLRAQLLNLQSQENVEKHSCIDNISKTIYSSFKSNSYSTKLRNFFDYILRLFTTTSNSDHVIVPTIQHSTHLIRCNVFDNNLLHQLPSYHTMQTIHLRNMDNFLNAKCDNNDEIKTHFLKHIADSNTYGYKEIFLDVLKIIKKLTLDQTTTFFINSKQCLRHFCRENAKLHRIIGVNIYKNENLLRGVVEEEKMKTSKFDVIKMDISEAEMKHNNDEPTKAVGIMVTNPTEVIMRSFCDELNKDENDVSLEERLGYKTLVVAAGIDKADHGSQYVVLLCTKEENNNSPVRLRPVCYMETPAICNHNNIKRLLNPIFDYLQLLKENTCVLKIKNGDKWYGCALQCDVNYKKELDKQWKLHNKVKESDY